MNIASLPGILARGFRRFRSESRGSITVESVIMLPLLFWWYIAAFQYFDAYREKSLNIKAAYTLADLITREELPVNAAFINGMGEVFDYLVRSDETTWIRVTSIQWNDTTRQMIVLWSYATKLNSIYTNANIGAQLYRIPIMSHLDTAIIVETHGSLTPIVEIGITSLDFDQFVVMRPRFVPLVLWGIRP